MQAWRNEALDGTSSGAQSSELQVQRVARALRGVAERRRQRRHFVRIAAALAVAASVLGVAFGGWLVGRGDKIAERSLLESAGVRFVAVRGAPLVTDVAGHVLSAGASLGAGAELQTREGRVELAVESGAHTEVSERAELRIAEVGSMGRETIVLRRGRVDVEVPKRVAPGVFSVKTPDALVVVHGTRFSVDVDPLRRGMQTRVEVTRGVVAVQSEGKEVRLLAGEGWPSDAVQAAPQSARTDLPQAALEARAAVVEGLGPQSSLQQRSKPQMKRAVPAHAAKRRAAVPSRPVAQSNAPAHELSEENRLFASAMEQKKTGDLSRALRGVEFFLARYPGSVLRQEAEVEQFRLLRRLGRSREAARRARQYLGDYREGYARDEARDIALESP
jgi:hypothetical protein